MAEALVVSSEEINRLIYAYFLDSGFQHAAYVLAKEGQLEKSPCFRKHVPYGSLVELLSKALLYLETEAHWKGNALTRNCTGPFSLIEQHVCALDPTIRETVTLEDVLPIIEEVQPPQTNEQPPLAAEQPPPEEQLSQPAERPPQPEERPPQPEEQEPHPEEQPPQINGISELAIKRKAIMPGPDNVHKEKRARTELLEDSMDIDSIASSSDGKTVKVTESTSQAAAPQEVPISGVKKMPKVSASYDDLGDTRAADLLRQHKTEVFVCAWNPADKNLLASGSRDSIVHIWDVPLHKSDSGSQKTPIPVTFSYYPKHLNGDLTSLVWSPDGTLLAIGSYDAILRICNASGELYFTNSQHEGAILAIQFSISGEWLLSASLDGTACVWDIKHKTLHQQFKCHPEACLDIEWLTEKTFAACGADGTIQVRAVGKKSDPSDNGRQLLGHAGEVNQIKCNPSHTRLASCSDDHTVRIWNIGDIVNKPPRSNEEVLVLSGHTHSVTNIAWCPVTPPGQHELLASSSFDGSSRLWDTVTGECLKVFNDHMKAVYAIAFSPDGRFLASASGDGWLHIYDIKMKIRKWSWFAGSEKPGIFEIDWQQAGRTSRLAMALESHRVGVIDLTHVPCLR